MGSPGSKISIITYSQTLTTNLKEIHQNVTIINRMVNESAKDNQTSDRSTKLNQLRSSTKKTLTDTYNILKEFNDKSDEQLKKQKDQFVNDFKTALLSFEAAVSNHIRIEKKSIEAARAMIEEKNIDVNDMTETLDSLLYMQSLYLDSFDSSLDELKDIANAYGHQLDSEKM